MTKICTKCKIEKEKICFSKDKKAGDGLSWWCKICVKSYKDNNKEIIKKQRKVHYENNKDNINEKNRKRINTQDPNVKFKICIKCKIEKGIDNFYKANKSADGYDNRCKQCIKEYNAIRYKNNKDHMLKITKKYMQNHKHEMRIFHKNYKKKRAKEDINYKIAGNIRSWISRIVKNGNLPGSFVRDLGCSIEELKIHLESKFYYNKETGETMSWDNYGLYGWHIDHIMPLISFNLTDREQFLKACHYTNLQPLWAKDNLSKGSKII